MYIARQLRGCDDGELADIGLRKFGENAAAARLPSARPYALDQIRERG